jgi:hypothetical protein
MPLDAPGLAVLLRLGEDSGVGPETRYARAIVEGVRELGLSIRAGLHTGECEMADGKVAGIAVHTGARPDHMPGTSALVEKTAHETRPTGRLTLLAMQPVGGRSIAI